MRMMSALAAAAAAACCLIAPASAQPTGAISCPVDALSAKQRVDLGASLMDGSGAVATRAHDAIARPAAACAKANHWTAARTDAAITWGVWALMGEEAERRSGLSPADLTILHAYVDEDPSLIDGLDRFSAAQVDHLVEALRQRGAHLHDAGKDTERELGFLMLVKEQKSQEAAFAGG